MNKTMAPSSPENEKMSEGSLRLISRQQALKEFQAILKPDAAERVLNVHGGGGLGKTWFLKDIQRYCHEHSLLYNEQIIDFYDTARHRVSGLMASIIQELDPEHKYFGPYLKLRAEFDRLRARGFGGRAMEPISKRMDCAFLTGLQALGTAHRRQNGNKGVVLLLDTFEVVQDGRVGRWVLEHLLGPTENLCAEEKNPPPIVATQDIAVVIAGRPKISQERTPALIRYCEPGNFSPQEVEGYVQKVLGDYQDIDLTADPVQQLATWIADKTGGHPVQVALALDLANLTIATHGTPALTDGGLLTVLQEIEGRGDLATGLIEQIMELLGKVSEQQWAVLFMVHLRRRFTRRLCATLMNKPPNDYGLGVAFSAFENLYMTKYRHLWGTFRLLPKEARQFEEATVSLHDLIRDQVYQRYWQGSIPLSFVQQGRQAGIFPVELDTLWEKACDWEGEQPEIPHDKLLPILHWLDDQAVEFYETHRRELETRRRDVDKEQDPSRWVEYEYQQHALMAEQLLYEMDRDLEEGWRRWRRAYYEAFEAYQQGYCEQLELTVLSAWPNGELEADPRKREIREMARVRQLWWKIQRSGPARERAIRELEQKMREQEPMPGSEPSELLADVHNALGWAYDLEGRLRTSLRHRALAADLFRRSNRPWDLAMVLDFLGRSYHLAGRFSQADAAWREALSIARRLKDRYRIASVTMKWGHSLNVQGETGQALGYGQVAVRVFRSLGDDRSLGLALSYLGGIYVAQGKFIHAERVLKEAQRYTDQFGGPADQVRLMRTWGEFHRRRAQAGEEYAQADDFDRSQQVLVQARQQAQEEEFGRWETEAREELGALFRDQAEAAVQAQALTQAETWWPQAETELRAALAAYEREGSFFKVADMLDDLCEMYETQHRAGVNGRAALEEHLDRLTRITTEHDFPRYRSRAAEMRARLAWEDGRYEEAVRHYVNACACAGLHTRAGEAYRSSYDRLLGELEAKLNELKKDEDKVDLARLALHRWGRTDQVTAHPQFTQACYRIIYPAQARLDEQAADDTFDKGRAAYERGACERAREWFAEAFQLYVHACDQIGRLTDASHENYLQYMALVGKLERRFYDLPDLRLALPYSEQVQAAWQRLEQAERHPAVLEVCRRARQMADLVQQLVTEGPAG